MSTEGKGKFNARSMPLMKSAPFYAVFLFAPNTQKKLQQLERALELFIEALEAHEVNENLKRDKVEEARGLLEEVKDVTIVHREGGNFQQGVSILKTKYQNTVNQYVNTATELEAFGRKFKDLWEQAPTASGGNNLGPTVIERTNRGPFLSRNAAPGRAKTVANKLLRKIFGNALAKVLMSPQQNTAVPLDADPDVFDTYFSSDFHAFQNVISAELNNFDIVPDVIREGSLRLIESDSGLRPQAQAPGSALSQRTQSSYAKTATGSNRSGYDADGSVSAGYSAFSISTLEL